MLDPVPVLEPDPGAPVREEDTTTVEGTEDGEPISQFTIHVEHTDREDRDLPEDPPAALDSSANPTEAGVDLKTE